MSLSKNSAVVSVALATLLATAKSGCVVRQLLGQSTGSCKGACEHYRKCSATPAPTSAQQCLAECPAVLTSSEAIHAFERLSCEDAVEFVDGERAKPKS